MDRYKEWICGIDTNNQTIYTKPCKNSFHRGETLYQEFALLDEDYKDISIILFLVNHCLINFLFFAIALFCVSIFKKPSNGFLYVFYKYRFIIYALILSKLLFPISFGFDCYWNFMLSIVQNKEYYLFIPLIFEKIIMVFLFTKYCFIFAREHKEEYMYIVINYCFSNNISK